MKQESRKPRARRAGEVSGEIKPSLVTDSYWIHATRKKGKYRKPTTRSGKWLVFVDAKEVDEMWCRVKRVTEDGILGDSSKVATAKASPLAADRSERVICVYTYDYLDGRDVKRIREELKKLGVTKRIPYKADEDTLAGRYQVTGHRNISKYYE